MQLSEKARMELVRETLKKWYRSPQRFAWDVFHRELWKPRQVQMANLIRDHRFSWCASGQKTGKSFTIALMSIWWVVTHERGVVFLTAPTGQQVDKVLWTEVRRLYGLRRSHDIFPSAPNLRPANGWYFNDYRFIYGRTSSAPDNLGGTSSDHLLIIVDEASGFPERMWPALYGNLGGGGHLAMFGNPLRDSGEFIDAQRQPGWHGMRVPSYETPNAVNDTHEVPGLADRDFLFVSLKREEGINLPRDVPFAKLKQTLLRASRSNAFIAARICGYPPTQGSNTVIPQSLARAGQERFDAMPDRYGVLELGVDVARYGDDNSTIASKRGRKVWTPYWANQHLAGKARAVCNGFDTVEVAGMVADYVRAVRRRGEPVIIKVDATGSAGVADLLNSWAGDDVGPLGLGVHVVPVNVSEKPVEEERFALKRDELWWMGREFLQEGGAISDDPKTFAELTSAQYGFDARARRKVEGKDDMKKRLKRSPDGAEATLLSIAYSEHNERALPEPMEQSELAVVGEALRWDLDRGF